VKLEVLIAHVQPLSCQRN